MFNELQVDNNIMPYDFQMHEWLYNTITMDGVVSTMHVNYMSLWLKFTVYNLYAFQVYTFDA